MELNYEAPPVLSQFMQSNARMRVVRGPFGSGKSVGSMVEIIRRATMQARDKNGLRRSRWAVVRNTMPMLRDTTLKTWRDWVPDGSCGWWKETGKTFYLEFGDVRAEVLFRALDDAADVRNLLSLELTGAFINEAREIPREIVEGLQGRIDRFPSRKDGGATWAGIWADTNAPEEGSYWWAMMEGLDPETGQPKPNEWDCYVQPPGMLRVPNPKAQRGYDLVPNPQAENVENLAPGYYENLCKDASDEYIKVYVLNEYGSSKAGKPVHPMFKQDWHVANDILVPNPKQLLVISADFGLTPAMTLKQQDTAGRVLTLDEIVTEGMGLKRAIEERLKPLLRNKYTDFNIQITGDPAGNTASQTDEKSCVDIFRAAGFKRVRFAYSNNPVHRTNATDTFLSRMTESGPAYLVSPQCAYLIRGMKGGYHYKVNKFGITSETPEKNIYSHVCFVAGTPVTMAGGGEKPIEDVQAGDFVATPLGPQRVKATMHREAEVITVAFSDGRALTGTAEHPVWTGGYTPLETVGYANIKAVTTEEPLWNALFKLWHLAGQPSTRSTSSTGYGITGSPPGTTKRTLPGTSSTSIGRCGSRITGLFRTGMKYITVTATEGITSLRTWCRSQCMRTTLATCAKTAGLSEAVKICGALSPGQLSGGSKTQKPQQRSGGEGWLLRGINFEGSQWNCIVRDAERSSEATPVTQSRSFAAPRAKVLSGALRVLTTKSAHAAYVGLRFMLTNMPRRRPVRGLVVEKSNRVQNVYNIEVETAHCYYANGVLVSNCEAGQYADMFFERGFESVDRAQQRKAYLQQVQSGAGIYSRRS